MFAVIELRLCFGKSVPCATVPPTCLLNAKYDRRAYFTDVIESDPELVAVSHACLQTLGLLAWSHAVASRHCRCGLGAACDSRSRCD